MNTGQAYEQAKHWVYKALLLPLLHAWHKEGIETLLFKGFYLAEFVYPQASERPYSDVDLVIHPRDAERARAIARDLGWREVWAREASLYRFSHEEANLRKGGVLLEPHRLILDTTTPWHSVQSRLTEAAWTASSLLDWEGLQLRVLRPEDSILLGVVLARSWSGGDDWRLKESDYRDIETLSAAANVSQVDLERRAADLHCSRTLHLFLKRCNPWLGICDTAPPSRFDKASWQLSVMPERGHLGLERLGMRASRLPGTIWDGLRYGLSAMNKTKNMQETKTLSVKEKERIVRGVKLAATLRWPFERDPCVKRSKALFDALARAGYPVRLEQGQDDAGVPHARVSLSDFSPRDLIGIQTCRFNITEVIESNGEKKLSAKLTLGETMALPQINDDTVLARSPEQVSVNNETETIVLGSQSGQYFSLSGVGSDAWQLLQEPRRFADLRDSLLDRYDVAAEVLETDLRELLGDLSDAGLVLYQETK